MPFSIQAKILRLLQEKSIERLGGRDPIPVDVRIIAATNRDLETALAEGRFREDLYYRLKVVTIWLPPLRERRDDIPTLAGYFLTRFALEMGVNNPGMTQEAKKILSQYNWPGNIRELANTIQKALIFSRGYLIRPEEVSQVMGGGGARIMSDKDALECLHEWVRHGLLSDPEENAFDSFMDRFASVLVSEALDLTNGNRTRAAKLLGLSRPTLQAKIDKYRLRVHTSVKTEED
jgi:DNA-binding NtrC family response regulator